MKKKVLLVGGRSKARSLALSLMKRGYHVTAINKSYEDCLKLSEIKKLKVIHGDGTKPFVLEDADIDNMDMVIALNAKDEDNLVTCELCKKRFSVKKTVSLVSDPRKTDFFYKMGIDSVVCVISAVTGIIEQQAFMDEMTNIVSIGEGRVQIAEVPISPNDAVVGKKLLETSLPKQVIVGCILRGNITLVPRGDTMIMSGDILVLVSANGQEQEAIKVLKGR